MQLRMAKSCPMEIVAEIDSGHSPELERPEDTAAAVLKAIEDLKTS